MQKRKPMCRKNRTVHTKNKNKNKKIAKSKKVQKEFKLYTKKTVDSQTINPKTEAIHFPIPN